MKKVISMLLCLALAFGIIASVPVSVNAKMPAQGKCGANVTYSFDSATGTLTISGKGAMTNYAPNGNKSPFAEQSDIKSVEVGSGVTSIGTWAFYDCYSLKIAVLGENVKTVSNYAFYGCIKLGSAIMQSNSVTSIGDGAFAHCLALSDTILPNSVTHVGIYAFEDTKFYKTIDNWDNYALYIGNCIVSGKYNVAYEDDKYKGKKPYISDVHQVFYPKTKAVTGHYTIKPGTTVMADSAFANCWITGITIPGSITCISKNAFAGTRLESITIPKSVKSIKESAFFNCKSLKSVSIAATVTSIGSNAFCYCKSLTKVTIPAGVKKIEDGAFLISGLKSVTIPKTVSTIGKDAFRGCGSLKSVTIKSGVKSIGENAFNECASLKSVTIPKSIKTIGKQALGYDYTGSVIKGFKIKGYKGSAAQKYAKKNKIKFVKITKK